MGELLGHHDIAVRNREAEGVDVGDVVRRPPPSPIPMPRRLEDDGDLGAGHRACKPSQGFPARSEHPARGSRARRKPSRVGRGARCSSHMPQRHHRCGRGAIRDPQRATERFRLRSRRVFHAVSMPRLPVPVKACCFHRFPLDSRCAPAQLPPASRLVPVEFTAGR
jgi:hypothetical protein